MRRHWQASDAPCPAPRTRLYLRKLVKATARSALKCGANAQRARCVHNGRQPEGRADSAQAAQRSPLCHTACTSNLCSRLSVPRSCERRHNLRRRKASLDVVQEPRPRVSHTDTALTTTQDYGFSDELLRGLFKATGSVAVGRIERAVNSFSLPPAPRLTAQKRPQPDAKALFCVYESLCVLWSRVQAPRRLRFRTDCARSVTVPSSFWTRGQRHSATLKALVQAMARTCGGS